MKRRVDLRLYPIQTYSTTPANSVLTALKCHMQQTFIQVTSDFFEPEVMH